MDEDDGGQAAEKDDVDGFGSGMLMRQLRIMLPIQCLILVIKVQCRIVGSDRLLTEHLRAMYSMVCFVRYNTYSL